MKSPMFLIPLAAAFAIPTAFAQTPPTTTSTQDATTQDATASDAWTQDGTGSTQAATGHDATQSQAGAAQEATPTPQTGAPPAASGGQTSWAEVDTDGSGAISKTESAQMPSLAQVFGQADADADGQLTPDEYKAYVAAAAPPTGADGTDD